MWLMSNELGSAFKTAESESKREYLESMGWSVVDRPVDTEPHIDHVVMAPGIPADGVKDDSTLYVAEPKPEQEQPVKTRKKASK